MINIINERIKKYTSSDILKNYRNKYDYYKPASNSAYIYNMIESEFYKVVNPTFECIELSPITPLALNSVLTKLSQNNSLSTIRNSEVISDSSISMALECAYRIKNNYYEKLDAEFINLASSQRLLRMQKYGNGKKSHWAQHFKALSMLTAFRNSELNMFTGLEQQIEKWILLIQNLQKNGLDISNITVNIAYLPIVKEIYRINDVNNYELYANSVNPDYDIFNKYNILLSSEIDSLEKIEKLNLDKEILLTIKNSYLYLQKNLFLSLQEKFPTVNFNFQLNRKSGLNYYEHYCYEVIVTFLDGKKLCLVDGGITNWTGQLLSDKKEKCVSSGMGMEYIAKVYKIR